MSRKLNFSAGPAALPLTVLEQAQKDFVDFQGAGLSLIESSHRTALYDDVHKETEALIRELFGVPEDYYVLFLGGGATLQFGMIPMNFLKEGKTAEYINSGAWAKKAISDAKKIGSVNVVWDGEESKYTTLPSDISASADSAYFHITSNETIGGVQWKEFPKTGNVPLIADMSSDIMSRKVNVSDFDMIYAGAQKNIGPAGVALVIVKKSLVESGKEGLPAYLSYNTHGPKDSMYNTPPVFSIYIMNLVMKWLKSLGGIEGIQKINEQKAKLIYDAINGSNGYYNCPVDERYRSNMNVVFTTPGEDTDKKFITEAAELGMISLKGHRSVGGCRASLYNAMPVEGVEKLAAFMKDFASKN